MIRDYRPVDATKKLPARKAEKSTTIMKELVDEANLDMHQCLNFKNYVLIKYDLEVRKDSIVTIKNKRTKKDLSKEFPRICNLPSRL